MTVSLERPVRLTELDAVNFMLRAVGESPVSALASEAKPSAVKAQQVLGEQSLVVQSDNWNFLVEEVLELEPNATSGFVYLPENIAALEPVDTNKYDRLQERGGRLYNPTDSTFVFTETVKVRASLALPFSDLPMPARWYITTKAALQFVNSEEPRSASLQVTANDVSEAKRLLEAYDRRLKKGGMRRNNPHFRRMRGNR